MACTPISTLEVCHALWSDIFCKMVQIPSSDNVFQMKQSFSAGSWRTRTALWTEITGLAFQGHRLHRLLLLLARQAADVAWSRASIDRLLRPPT